MEDPAFVWQQPDRATRPVPPPSGRSGGRSPGPPSATRWVTLHEAEEVTGVPASTLRNWARKERIPTRFDLSTEGQVRMVGLDEAVARARQLGRLRPRPTAEPGPAPASGSASASASGPVREPPEGSVLVPVDAWNRMINQLGNLHEAGQQLAEARERAARAETEAAFLRERLAELRTQPEPDVHIQPPAPPADPQPASTPGTVEPAWLYLYRRWENRTRRRR